MADLPLVSCIMPTADRRPFIPDAILHFQEQDYANSELVILDDGSDKVEDAIPVDPRIRYIQLPVRATVGAKRNLACQRAAGSVIVHWDDDDWHAPYQLQYQVSELLRSGAQVCGIRTLLFYDPKNQRAWRYTYPASQRFWLSGSSLCYRREYWQRHPFPDVNVGEAELFVWSGEPREMLALSDYSFHIGIVHKGNVSPKQTDGEWWRPHPVEEVLRLMRPAARQTSGAIAAAGATAAPGAIAACGANDGEPFRNVYMCLVHESPECVLDLVRNLRHVDPDSTVLLYNGGKDPSLLDVLPFDDNHVILHPNPRPQTWGALHSFALDCMRYALTELHCDSLTVVDSDQLALRQGYAGYLASYLRGHTGVGMLVSSSGVQRWDSNVPPAVTAWKEVELWRPFLRRFRQGEEKFVHWAFWPSTVFTRQAAQALVELWDTDDQLHSLLEQSKMWATEEVLFPTLAALLGFGIHVNPCNNDYVRYKYDFSLDEVDQAMSRSDVYWIHPVPRAYGERSRTHVRRRLNHYMPDLDGGQRAGRDQGGLLLTLPILARMKRVEGWLEDDEADALIACTATVVRDLPGRAIVEVGSYCGRSTIVMASVIDKCQSATRLYAIDPHDGRVGATDQGLVALAPTFERFRRNISQAGLDHIVEPIRSHSANVRWTEPIALLFVDGLHDFASAARDFNHFERHVYPGGLVAFHDYADYYPGVQAVVDGIAASGRYRRLERVGSLVVLRKSVDGKEGRFPYPIAAS